jgi:hypothetical protein
MLRLSNISAIWRTLLYRVPLVPLLVALLVAVPIGAAALYYSPYPDVSPWLFVWMVVLSLGMLVLSSRWDLEEGLKQEPKQRPRGYLSGLLSAARFFVWYTTFLVGAMVFRHYAWGSIHSTVLHLTSSLGCLVLFALLFRRRETALYRAMASKVGILAQWAALLLLAVLFVEFVPNKALEVEEQSRHGPAAPWSVQLSTAQSEMAKFNMDAVLESIDASTIYARQPDYNTTLSVRFHFVTPMGDAFLVTLDDTNPQNTLHIERKATSISTTYRPVPTPQQLDMLRMAISTVKLSPRDALQRTVSEVLPLAEQHSKTWTNPWITLHLAGLYTQEQPNVYDKLLAVWEVRHVIVAGFEQRNFWLNPETGEIVKRTTIDP